MGEISCSLKMNIFPQIDSIHTYKLLFHISTVTLKHTRMIAAALYIRAETEKS